jgi:hypothetical protein
VDPSSRSNYAIHVSSEYGHIEVVNRLIQDKRVNPSFKALYYAQLQGHTDVVNLLNHL